METQLWNLAFHTSHVPNFQMLLSHTLQDIKNPNSTKLSLIVSLALTALRILWFVWACLASNAQTPVTFMANLVYGGKVALIKNSLPSNKRYLPMMWEWRKHFIVLHFNNVKIGCITYWSFGQDSFVRMEWGESAGNWGINRRERRV